VLVRTPVGVALAPARDGRAIAPPDFDKLPPDERQAYQDAIDALQLKMQEIVKQIPRWEQEARAKVRALAREATTLAAQHLIAELRAKFADLPDVIGYLDQVESDVIASAADFIRVHAHDGQPPDQLPENGVRTSPFQRYKVNLLVDNSGLTGAPVIYEDHPTHDNLLGRVEHLSRMGALITDFTLIKAGALHRANGGYLILDARRLLIQPYAWEGLKRILRSREIRIESIGQMLSLISTVSLDPEPIGLDVKVVMIGDRKFRRTARYRLRRP